MSHFNKTDLARGEYDKQHAPLECNVTRLVLVLI